MSLPAYRFQIEGLLMDVGAAGPGLAWDTCVTEAVRRWYVAHGEMQGRWVLVEEHVSAGRRGTYGRYLVRTSREDELLVLVRPWGTKPRR